jgi:uncharacterized protein (DUF1697 family)
LCVSSAEAIALHRSAGYTAIPPPFAITPTTGGCPLRADVTRAGQVVDTIDAKEDVVAGRHVALIRGINVGRAKRVAMADLRVLVEGLEFSDVRTLLNSGNVVFTCPSAAAANAGARIEKAMAGKLGVSARVTVLTAREVATAVADNPLLDVASNHSRLMIAVPARAIDHRRLKPLAEQDWTPEVLALGARVAYLWCPDGILASRLSEAIGRTLGAGVTSRNWATLSKLHALAGDRP